MITYRSRFLQRGEVWYDDEPDDRRAVDWIQYRQRSQPVPGAETRYFYTYAIDLTRSQDELRSNLGKDTAYKIRRARERDKIICETCDPKDARVLDEFEEMYNVFAGLKGLTPLHRPRMENMVTAGVLDLSVARTPQGNALVYHADYCNHQRATNMELPSLYRKVADSGERNFIGRANRYLTWNNILRYRDQGLKCFDFGGWYHGTDPAMLKINDFKQGFGGQVVREYQSEQVLTFKGRLILAVATLLNQVSRLRPVSPPPPEQNRSENTAVVADLDAGCRDSGH